MTCSGSDRSAFYSIVRYGRDEPTAADKAYERAALKAFAERSAKAHGCKKPAKPAS
ncbi:hypothetical protein [Streptomyces sp. KLOTTS4A1]|uniref:hypothetical protein n=1 Tax=Streptomyces sp. KLOTTS4A1 TaxID=3390996 RepID=UPI0039F62192